MIPSHLEIIDAIERDDFAMIDARKLIQMARAVAKSQRQNGKLPWSAAMDAREAHEILTKVVAALGNGD